MAVAGVLLGYEASWGSPEVAAVWGGLGLGDLSRAEGMTSPYWGLVCFYGGL